MKHLKKLKASRFLKLVRLRKSMIKGASGEELPPQTDVNRLARHLHPHRQHLKIAQIIDQDPNGTVKTYLLEPDSLRGTGHPAYFQAGQYVTVYVTIDGHLYSRPYSLSSAPYETLVRKAKGTPGHISITVKSVPGGKVSNYILNHWKIGDPVLTSGPMGQFTYEPLRDASHILGLAGGSGVTPFLSLAKAIVRGEEDCSLILLYGVRNIREMLFQDDWKELEKSGKIQVVPIISDPLSPADLGKSFSNTDAAVESVPMSPADLEKHPSNTDIAVEEYWLSRAEQGLITAELMKKYAPTESKYSVFICGPQAMVNFVDKELPKLDLERKYIRHEVHGEVLIPFSLPDYPSDLPDLVQITVHGRGKSRTIQSGTSQTLLRILEQNGFEPKSHCRGGECGFCRARLISGSVYVPDDLDHRRKADADYGYIHPCCSYPLSDLEIEITQEQ